MIRKNIEPLQELTLLVDSQYPLKETQQRGRPKGAKNKKDVAQFGENLFDKVLSKAEQIEKRRTKNWQNYEVYADEEFPDEQYLLTINNKPFIGRNSIVTVTGKPKVGKTYISSSVIGALLNGCYLGMQSHLKSDEPIKIVFFDTEQTKGRTLIVQKRINKICKHEESYIDDRLKMLNVRALSPEERIKILEETILDVKPILVVIDGIRDLLRDFNDIDKSGQIIDFLLRMTTETGTAILVVIHQNKADTNARGHLGSELMNKSDTVIELKVQSNKSINISPTYCRDVPFDEFAMRINDDGLPELCELSHKKDEADRDSVLKDLFFQVLDKSKVLNKKDAQLAIVTIEKCSDKTAGRRIDEAIKLGIIEEYGNKQIRLSIDN